MDFLSSEGVAWANAYGLQMVSPDDKGTGALTTHAPMSLVPTPLSKGAFLHAVELSTPFNILVDKVSRDLAWMYEKLDPVLEYDEFTARLVKICKLVHQGDGPSQKYYLGVNRSDYMLDKGVDLLQVELNTIASSFGCLSARVSRMHKFLLERYGTINGVHQVLSELYSQEKLQIKDRLPENSADVEIPAALARAAKFYHSKEGLTSRPTVLFVVQDGERNSFDQRWLEYELWSKHGVATVRKSLAQILATGKLGEKNGLLIDGEHVSVVYFRAGYTPDDYPTDQQWEGRELIEKSHAIKCPSIAYHLVGTKKVQQALAIPGEIERFMGGEIGALLRASFAGLWSLDASEQDEEAKSAVEKAIANPGDYVVKPQREGGGNNIYGDEVRESLQTMSQSELASFILMQRIFPKQVDAILVRNGQHECVSALQELGMYGVYLGNGDGDVVFNNASGHLLRTKMVGVDEGGVATGFSCLDSPYLV